MQALAGVELRHAVWRPRETATWNIYEVTTHVADIMQTCGDELGASRGLEHVDHTVCPLATVLTEEDWTGTLAFVQRAYKRLEDALVVLTRSSFDDVSRSRAYGRTWSLRDHIQGVALHNTYHAAQIVWLRKRQGAWTELA